MLWDRSWGALHLGRAGLHPEEYEHQVGTLDGGREGCSGDGERNQWGDMIWGRKQEGF